MSHLHRNQSLTPFPAYKNGPKIPTHMHTHSPCHIHNDPVTDYAHLVSITHTPCTSRWRFSSVIVKCCVYSACFSTFWSGFVSVEFYSVCFFFAWGILIANHLSWRWFLSHVLDLFVWSVLDLCIIFLINLCNCSHFCRLLERLLKLSNSKFCIKIKCTT